MNEQNDVRVLARDPAATQLRLAAMHLGMHFAVVLKVRARGVLLPYQW